MKLTVRVTVTKVLECEIEVKNFDEARSEIKKLIPDVFDEVDNYQDALVLFGNTDVTGDVQPSLQRLY